MKDRIAFRKKLQSLLDTIDPQVLSYDENEFWMIRSPYEYIEHYALSKCLLNTAIALPLARGLHNGSHRKSSITRGGVSHRLPYVIHCLLVCRMLVDLHVPVSKEEEDILLASALCHDMIEDIPFEDHGRELFTRFHLDPGVYETVKQVSKRKDFTPEEERAFFHGIASNKLALLVKLSDRSHNVEDLYNMSVWKVHEYIGETDQFFLPMCAYAHDHYPELNKTIEIFQDKIGTLTHVSKAMVDRCENREQELQEQLQSLTEENTRLRDQYRRLLLAQED